MSIESIRQLKEKAKMPREAKRYSIPKKSKKRIEQERQQKEAGGDIHKMTLERWFSDIQVRHSMGLGTACMECGQWIPQSYIRHATAHLLPKKLFVSCATHPLNYLILGAGCGCHEKTHRVDKFIQMKVWPEAARRIKEIIPTLPFDELRHISNQLTIALENT